VRCGLYEGIRDFDKTVDPFFKTTAIDHSAIPPRPHFIRKTSDQGFGQTVNRSDCPCSVRILAGGLLQDDDLGYP
jgi:hypothetical protein